MFEESTTFQKILRKGRAEGGIAEARRILLRQGRQRFGEPDAATLASVDAIEDIDRLESLIDELVNGRITAWNEMLAM